MIQNHSEIQIHAITLWQKEKHASYVEKKADKQILNFLQ